MTQVDIIRNGIIDKLLTISDKNYLIAFQHQFADVDNNKYFSNGFGLNLKVIPHMGTSSYATKWVD